MRKSLLAGISLAVLGLVGCTSLDEQKQRSITEFIPEKYLEERVLDINEDGHLDMVYLTKSNKDYELKIMKGNNDGSFTNPKLIRNYGNIDPRTLNFLTFFYHDISKVIEGKVR